MSKIIALIDGSEYSKSVCEYAAWIAKAKSSSVEVIHSLSRRDASSVPTDMSGNIGFGARSSLLEDLAQLDQQKSQLAQKRGRAILEDAQALIEKAGVKQVEAKLRKDDIIDALHDFEEDADLIIVGKRGETADFARDHLGANMERIVRASTKPVFIASREFKPIKKILIAFDGGKSALKAVEHLAKSQVFGGSICHLITVGEATDQSKAAIDDAQALLKDGGYKVTSEITLELDESIPTEIIISDKVKDDHYDMLVMGAYGHSRIRNLIIGSTTTELLRLCQVPVLMFR